MYCLEAAAVLNFGFVAGVRFRKDCQDCGLYFPELRKVSLFLLPHPVGFVLEELEFRHSGFLA